MPNLNKVVPQFLDALRRHSEQTGVVDDVQQLLFLWSLECGSLCVSVSLFSLSLCLCLSLLSVSLSVSVSVSVSVSLSVSLSVCLCLSVCLSLSLSVCLSLCLCLSLPASLQRFRKGYLNDLPSKDQKGLSQRPPFKG